MILEEMLKDERKEGRIEGREEGRAEGARLSLCTILECKGRIPDMFRNRLSRAKSGSIEKLAGACGKVRYYGSISRRSRVCKR